METTRKKYSTEFKTKAVELSNQRGQELRYYMLL
jgi:transposase-like protein